MKLPYLLSVAVLFLMSGISRAEPSVEEMNRAFGLPLWQDESLWDDPAEDVAGRLGLPQESKTTHQSSYRLYAGEKVQLFDARPYSVALYGNEGNVHDLSIVFANRGDFGSLYSVSNAARTAVGKEQADLKEKERRALTDFPKALKADADKIEKALTAVLGPPVAGALGSGAQREQVRKWEWKGHVILLSMQRDQYVSVRIISKEDADKKGHPERVGYSEMRHTLQDRVEKRPNGDVIVGEIPMTNQGPKGYCVPATIERYLRYMGIDADMYMIAMAGGTAKGGGSSFEAMVPVIASLATSNLKHLASAGSSLKTENISKYIDAGLPLMWGLFVVDNLNDQITERSAARLSVSDWSDWKQKLKPARYAAARLQIDRTQGHMCLIVGYNKATGEIAISDSWGPRYAERWITIEEATAISQGGLFAISF
ncbi:MAG: C39 family peptidase [Verrucomicrobiota bacterium]